MTLEGKRIRKAVIASLLVLSANLLFCLTLWLSSRYDKISLMQLLYQMQTSVSGTSPSLAGSAVLSVGVLGTFLTLLQIGLYLLLSGGAKDRLSKWRRYRKYCSGRTCGFFARRTMLLAVSLLIVSVGIFSARLRVFSYVEHSVTQSDFIEENYVDPASAQLVFPQQKRNLIYIYLESMENTYTDSGSCENVTANYIPELTELAEKNVSFSHADGMGGAYSFEGTTWTAAALVAQTSGVPVKVSLLSDSYGEEDVYMPGITNLGDILQQQGYRNVLLIGSNGQFANREVYFTNHGNYQILDTTALKQTGRLDEDYYQWWGFEDEKLFAYAKEELTRLSAQDQPFNFTMLTADTHFPDGYVCPLCADTYENQYANVLACSSKQVTQFISWIQQQSFYENTTIVISGDHLTMDPEFLEGIDENYVRTTYNCIINAAVEPVQEKQRGFGTFDMFPTTLAALGVEIPGDRLALGTNLFSDQQTLTEKYGFEVLDTELQKSSAYYSEKFFPEETGVTTDGD